MCFQNPVYVRDLFGGKATVIVFGAPFNWNYAGSSREEMEAKNPGISGVIEDVMREFEIKRAFVPKPAFNAKVVTESDLTVELLPGFFRGADADGVILTKPGDAYFLASADCLAATVYDDRTGFIAALHCGRDALIDRAKINGDTARVREHESVIYAACKYFEDAIINHQVHDLHGWHDETGWDPELAPRERFEVFLAAGIRAETFDHPTVNHPYADVNTRMIAYLQKACPTAVVDAIQGKIDLFELVRHQLTWPNSHPVIEDDGLDTATSVNDRGEFLFHSNRRDKLKRNLVVVRLN